MAEDLAKHRPEVLLRHAGVKTHAPPQRLSLGIDANPLRMLCRNPAVVAQIEVDAETIAVAPGHVAPHGQHVAHQAGRHQGQLTVGRHEAGVLGQVQVA